ncbi:hypothetical protein ACHAAC_06665 [Aeromicrobium sp. CF4.19]|uniref:hypothetical protein n=1 Tax=Aeromicrobium sp. CF4.19 TaxID=3373082 RepID=UPI003EE76BE9
MNEFKPLDVARAIRDDEELSKVDKPFMWAATLRTDNKSRKVRASLEMLAKDAGFHPNTAYKVFASNNKAVMRYFEQPERSARSVQLRWLSTPTENLTPTPHGDSDRVREAVACPTPTPEVDSEDVWALARSRPPHGEGAECPSEVDSVPMESGPSASICSPSAGTAPLPSSSPVFLENGYEEAADTATPSGPLPGEPLAGESEATAEAGEDTRGMGLRRSFGDRKSPAAEGATPVSHYRGRGRSLS